MRIYELRGSERKREGKRMGERGRKTRETAKRGKMVGEKDIYIERE